MMQANSILLMLLPAIGTYGIERFSELPKRLLQGVIAEGAVMAGVGVLAGAAFGFVIARLAGSYFFDVKMPGALPVVLSAFVLLAAAVVASWLPAARAARIDVIQALRSE